MHVSLHNYDAPRALAIVDVQQLIGALTKVEKR
jgi:hypothetical protein